MQELSGDHGLKWRGREKKEKKEEQHTREDAEKRLSSKITDRGKNQGV